MDILDAIRTRRSVRAFTSDSIPRETLIRLLQYSANAPSAINMQPWEVHMVLGEERQRLTRMLLKRYRERAVACGPGSPHTIPDRFMARSRQCAENMTPLIERMGSDFRTYVNEGSLGFYGAPACALIFLDECFPPERMVDVGAFTAYLVLAAAAVGLASCPIGLITAYQDEIKDHLNIPATKRLIISVALGYASEAAAINEFKSPRAPLEQFVRWVE
jgi:nitroreductase